MSLGAIRYSQKCIAFYVKKAEDERLAEIEAAENQKKLEEERQKLKEEQESQKFEEEYDKL